MFKQNETINAKLRVKRQLESIVYLRQEVVTKKKVLDELSTVEKVARELCGSEDETLVQQLGELRDSLLNDLTALLALKNRIKRAIATLEDPRLRIIYEAKYLRSQTWDEVAQLLFFSIVHTRRLAERGYKLLAEVI